MSLNPGTRLALRRAQGDLEQGRKVGVYEVTPGRAAAAWDPFGNLETVIDERALPGFA